jgi:hypothetical protein
MTNGRSAHTFPLMLLRHDQRVNFGVAIAGDEPHALDLAKARDLIVHNSDVKHSVWPTIQGGKPLLNRALVGGIAQLWEERSNGCRIRVDSGANQEQDHAIGKRMGCWLANCHLNHTLASSA